MRLQDFTRSAVKEYLHSIVFVDDEIYGRGPGQAIDGTVMLPEMKSPFLGTQRETAAASFEDNLPPPYHPKQLLESFAREGMVCALYEPPRNFETGPQSELFMLCARADVVILDWNLYGQAGDNLLPLIVNLVTESAHSVPHHVRLCAIYTTTPNLQSVADAIFSRLRAASLAVDADQSLVLTAGSTRIIVLGKPSVGRTAAAVALEVGEDKLADRIIDEFTKMHAGLLPSFALHGLAALRRNSKRILDKFHAEMDGAFLLHRASLLDSDGEAAFEQLHELLAEEALAVMIDEEVPTNVSRDLAAEVVNTIELSTLDWPSLPGKSRQENQEVARRYLAFGASAIQNPLPRKLQDGLKRGNQFGLFHNAMGCVQTHAQQRLAALFNLRTNYVEKKLPTLGLGTIVRKTLRLDDQSERSEYSICLMPLCDGLRLPLNKTTSFPFWRLVESNADGRGIVISVGEKQYLNLFSRGKPSEKLWLGSFRPDESGSVTAKKEETKYCFFDSGEKLEWAAQLKPAHAQRVAHDIGQSFSRVGVVEAEWLRLIAGGSD